MDVYKFIDSKDMREYLKSLDYQFTAAEAAYLVGRKDRILLKEQLNAWQEIIDTMPDCVFPVDDPKLDKISTLDFLREYIALQQKLMNLFFCEKKNTSYEYGDSGWPNFASALKKSKTPFDIHTDSYHMISKKWNCTEKQITALVNSSGDIMSLWGCAGVFDGEHEEAVHDGMRNICSFMDNFNPMPSFPYGKGDILQHIFDDEGIIVDHINKDRIVCGYMYIVTEGTIRPYVYVKPWNCFIYERCNEEKAERVRRAFKEATTKMRDICKGWE